MADENDDLERLNQLFDELETISEADLMRKMRSIPEIEPSTDFRRFVWGQIDRIKGREAFWEGLFPRLSRPVWVAASLFLAVAWGVGIRNGTRLYNQEEKPVKNHSEIMLSEFSAPYSINSIEAWVVKNTLSFGEE